MIDGNHPPSAGLFDGFEGYRTPVLDDYHRVFDGGLVVLDANVLLNLYRYTNEARDDLLTVLDRIRDQLWVPHQVVAEFWQNRENVLIDPRDTKKTSKDLLGFHERASDTLRAWFNRVSLPEHHPTRDLLDTLDTAFQAVVTAIDEFDDAAVAATAARDTNSDLVLQRLEQLLAGRVGRAPGPADYTAALEEGRRRIEARDPPGYKDKSKGDENGDYLVWEQIVREGGRRGCDLLFVTGDVKDDWWRDVRGERRGPRLELVEELRDRGGGQLYMVRPTQLLDVARRTLDVQVSDESVEDADRVDRLAAERRLRVIEPVSCPVCDMAVDVLLGIEHGDTAHGECDSCGSRFFVHRKYGEASVGGVIGEERRRLEAVPSIPAAAYVVHEIDSAFPIVPSEHWDRIYRTLSSATRAIPLSPTPTIQDLNALTRHARDTQEEAGRRVTRSELNYVGRALLFSQRLSDDMSAGACQAR